MGLDLGSNELEGGAQDHAHQYWLPNMTELPNLAVVSYSRLPTSPRPAGRFDSDSYQVTAFALSPGACKILCVPFKSEVVFPTVLPEIKPSWPSKPNDLGASLPGAGPPGWGA